jgi:hypothetical protein
MHKEILRDSDSVTYIDQSDGKMYIKRFLNVAPLLEMNAAERAHGHNGYGKSRQWRKIASIPCIVIDKILREHGVNILDGSPEAEKYMMKFLRRNPKFLTVNKL